MKPRVSAEQTLFFYDLETSSLSPREGRIMQFAGQRTDMDLNPIGEPYNVLVRLSDDILPDPGALMITGITPQQAAADGLSEPEFCQMFMEQVAIPGTVMLGYNTVRFDDEFIRHTLWRNFWDPYAWGWEQGRSRWDLLDAVRMTRALRPDGINWPVDESGKAVNKLVTLTEANGIVHEQAHDALSDIVATIGLARLLRDRQPKLFWYLFEMRDKKQVAELVDPRKPQMFVYSSGRYDAAHEKTTVAYPLCVGSNPTSILVYDLRHDPTQFVTMSPEDLARGMGFAGKDQRGPDRLPVKELVVNRCPAVAPVGVIRDDETAERLGLDMDAVRRHADIIEQSRVQIVASLGQALRMRAPWPQADDVESQLYDRFAPDSDKSLASEVRQADERQLSGLDPAFVDPRYPELYRRYKARWYPGSLSTEDRASWDAWRADRISVQMDRYTQALAELSKRELSERDKYIVEELYLWGQSLAPID